MPNLTKTEKLAAIELALDYVHPDVESLIKQSAGEFTVSNMGQALEDHLFSVLEPNPATLLYGCYQEFYQQSESDEMAQGTYDEMISFKKELVKTVKQVQKAKLPLTCRNVRDAWEKKGFFAKPKKV